MTNKEIIENLNKNYQKILSFLVNSNHFDKYFVIADKYRKSEIDKEFKLEFKAFYRMNGPMGLSIEQSDVFFQLLSDGVSNFNDIAYKLYSIPRNGVHRLLFSFTTKLLHTIDNSLPIYDSKINNIFFDGHQINDNNFDIQTRIKKRIDMYENLKNRYFSLLKDKMIKDLINNFKNDSKRKMKERWRDNLISDTKILDSMIWQLDGVMDN